MMSSQINGNQAQTFFLPPLAFFFPFPPAFFSKPLPLFSFVQLQIEGLVLFSVQPLLLAFFSSQFPLSVFAPLVSSFCLPLQCIFFSLHLPFYVFLLPLPSFFGSLPQYQISFSLLLLSLPFFLILSLLMPVSLPLFFFVLLLFLLLPFFFFQPPPPFFYLPLLFFFFPLHPLVSSLLLFSFFPPPTIEKYIIRTQCNMFLALSS